MKFGKEPAQFTNFSSRVFVGKWNGERYEFQPGESKPYAYGKAFHFAKCLAKEELSRKGGEYFRDDWAYHVNVVIEKPEELSADPVFYDLFKKAFSENPYVEQSDEKSEDELIQQQVEQIKKARKGRPKKEGKVEKKEEKEEKEFEELNEN